MLKKISRDGQLRWSHHYSQCKICGTNEIRHKAHGLCKRCDANLWTKDHAKARKQNRDRLRFAGLREQFLEANPNCQICQSTDNLLVHHRNGNRKQNRNDNFATLCRSCHSKVHNCASSIKKLGKHIGLVKELLNESTQRYEDTPMQKMQSALKVNGA